MPRHVSYWLVPAAPARDILQERIRALAHMYNAPVFVPHVTIYSGESPLVEKPLDIIRTATRALREVRLQIDRLLYTEHFTKTLFVQFHASEWLRDLTETMRGLSVQPSMYRLDPHLSLLYKDMPEAEKQHLTATLQLPMSEIGFDEVWAISSSGATRTAADVRAWEVVARQRL